MEVQVDKKPTPIDKKIIVYDLIILQLENLFKDLRIIFPHDIVLKVSMDNLKVIREDKISILNKFRENLTLEIQNMISQKDEKLFDKSNKSLKNINFKRSSFVFARIRKMWESLDENNKNVVWKYLQFLQKLFNAL